MIGFRHSAAPATANDLAGLASKRRAEAAPGVGRDTDLVVISPTRGAQLLTANELAQLQDMYDDFEKATSTELANRLASFVLVGEPAGVQDGMILSMG